MSTKCSVKLLPPTLARETLLRFMGDLDPAAQRLHLCSFLSAWTQNGVKLRTECVRPASSLMELEVSSRYRSIALSTSLVKRREESRGDCPSVAEVDWVQLGGRLKTLLGEGLRMKQTAGCFQPVKGVVILQS